ncbi:hypothetical protein TUBRATIS_20450 [Tubulinosema ratisbonensis]|uniref:Uncharacterized protein n=1 Tax=Tubulinosema ratisbonensis TaxID=291195 RepID=A0A437AKC7_9MICR|nr:hypothetical protein TUBRATIS_20450 [Tubulinosema ratisbonensis]
MKIISNKKVDNRSPIVINNIEPVQTSTKNITSIKKTNMKEYLLSFKLALVIESIAIMIWAFFKIANNNSYYFYLGGIVSIIFYSTMNLTKKSFFNNVLQIISGLNIGYCLMIIIHKYAMLSTNEMFLKHFLTFIAYKLVFLGSIFIFTLIGFVCVFCAQKFISKNINKSRLLVYFNFKTMSSLEKTCLIIFWVIYYIFMAEVAVNCYLFKSTNLFLFLFTFILMTIFGMGLFILHESSESENRTLLREVHIYGSLCMILFFLFQEMSSIDYIGKIIDVLSMDESKLLKVL